MTVALWYGLTGIALFFIGLCGLALGTHLLRRLIGVNVMGSGVFLLLVAGAHGSPGGPDPVPHAMVLTGIVVAVSATALALALARRADTTDERDAPPGA
jgi:multicomponent Na+:H+ antiporter subunit C